MRLISLELENFRQHSRTKIEFSTGITIITGTNGSGKSTILEAISWAIYGTEATRGNKDSIKWNKAYTLPGRQKVKAELVFSLEDQVFKVVRELAKAEVYLEPNVAPIATTQDDVTKYLTEKLGMNRVEFFNTYFTGQKELDFLGNQKPIERKRFISKVLNYEKIREAQEQARTDKNTIASEILGAKQGLGDIDTLLEEKKEAQSKLVELNTSLSCKKADLEKHTLQLGKLHPSWSKIKKEKEEFNRFSTEIKFVAEKLTQLELNIKNLSDEYKNIEEKSQKLSKIEKYLDEYTLTEKKIIEQEKLQKFEYEKQKNITMQESLQNEIVNLTSKLKEVENSLNSKIGTLSLISELSDEISDLKEKITEDTRVWTSKKQEIKTIKQQKENELGKIATQSSLIEQKGEDGACPTCERALKLEFNKVISNFQDHISVISQEINALVEKETQLANQPVELLESKELLLNKEKDFNELNKLQGQILQEQKLVENLKIEIKTKNEQVISLVEKIKTYPKGFDKELLEELKNKFVELKKVYDEIISLKAQILNKDKVKASLDASIITKNETKNRKNELDKILKELNFEEDAYKCLEEQVLTTERLFQDSEKEVIQAEGEIKQIDILLSKIKENEKIYQGKLVLIKEKQDKANLLLELDRFYGSFLEKLNNQARPELSLHASKFLSELTDGRYTELELNDKYEICLFDDGELKPVISGGEEDIANLCVRIAISQMIAQRSGKTLSLLILDEVFGSLDESRRNNVVALLQGLQNNFEQVMLITHISDIKESIDNVIKVEYDEERGCSIVTQSEPLLNSNIEELSSI